jgi:hypothetical protein
MNEISRCTRHLCGAWRALTDEADRYPCTNSEAPARKLVKLPASIERHVVPGRGDDLSPAKNLAPLGREGKLGPFAGQLQPAFPIDLVGTANRLGAACSRLFVKLLSGGRHLGKMREFIRWHRRLGA